MSMTPKIGDRIYIPNSFHISNGSDDVCGGLATVSKIEQQKNGLFISVKEIPGHSYNWYYLETRQDQLKDEFGDEVAHLCPDVDTPWIEEGDIVNGEKYKGNPIW